MVGAHSSHAFECGFRLDLHLHTGVPLVYQAVYRRTHFFNRGNAPHGTAQNLLGIRAANHLRKRLADDLAVQVPDGRLHRSFRHGILRQTGERGKRSGHFAGMQIALT